MPMIPLTQGQVARVDWIDYKRMSERRWCATWNPVMGSFYAVRGTRCRSKGIQQTISMHREVLGLGTRKEDDCDVDHKNHDTLDNRKSNLRICTHRENHENRRRQSPHGAGVYFVKRLKSKPFHAHARVGGRKISIGYFATAKEATTARRFFLRHIK